MAKNNVLNREFVKPPQIHVALSKKILRLTDANLNRAREGLRVLEDSARFIFQDEELFKNFRSKRHGLDLLTRAIYPQLLLARESRRDPGRAIAEKERIDFDSILWANFRRCEESLRVLEEYGKLISRRAAGGFKKIRFEMYDLEKKIYVETKRK